MELCVIFWKRRRRKIELDTRERETRYFIGESCTYRTDIGMKYQRASFTRASERERERDPRNVKQQQRATSALDWLCCWRRVGLTIWLTALFVRIYIWMLLLLLQAPIFTKLFFFLRSLCAFVILLEVYCCAKVAVKFGYRISLYFFFFIQAFVKLILFFIFLRDKTIGWILWQMDKNDIAPLVEMLVFGNLIETMRFSMEIRFFFFGYWELSCMPIVYIRFLLG